MVAAYSRAQNIIFKVQPAENRTAMYEWRGRVPMAGFERNSDIVS